MRKPFKLPVIEALPDVKVPEPRISKLTLFILKFLARPYLSTFFGSAKVTLLDDDVLFDAFKRALAGESRCIIAFRHANGAEPQLLTWFFLYKLKSYAAKKGIRFAGRPHAVFVYGYEVARWGGAAARIVMPNIGAMPIHHSKMDSKGMARIFKAITEGPYPLALAPEGQVSYFTDSLPHLENGTIFIGFQAASQMADKNINIPVEILPLSIHLRYDKHGEAAMIKLLGKIEKLCDISNGNLPFTERLRQCREYILKINENRYNIKSDDSVSFETRLEKIVNAALETAERMLGINSGGSPKSDAAKDGAVSGDDFFPRLYKVRQLCWDKIFLPGVVSLEQKTVVERNAMDLGAGEAWYISRHQELADFGWYFRRPLPTEDAALHNRIEYVQNLYDFANRTMGGAIANRVNIFPRKVIIHAATVINLTERLPRYKENKKCAIAAGAADLEKAYLDSIKKANDLPN